MREVEQRIELVLQSDNVSALEPNCVDKGSLVEKLALKNKMLEPVFPSHLIHNLVPINFIHLDSLSHLPQLQLQLFQLLIPVLILGTHFAHERLQLHPVKPK